MELEKQRGLSFDTWRSLLAWFIYFKKKSFNTLEILIYHGWCISGISITSTALVFENRGFQITLLDTPGHQDFGEDTYRYVPCGSSVCLLLQESQTSKNSILSLLCKNLIITTIKFYGHIQTLFRLELSLKYPIYSWFGMEFGPLLTFHIVQ